MKVLFTVIVILFTKSLYAQSYSGPESAEYDYANHRWLIANTQSHQVIARDSNGTLTVFINGLVSGPYGIEIVGDTLYCCSGSAIKGYRLTNASPVFNVDVGATFLNGLTHDLNGNLYATDFSAKTIYKINISTQNFSMIASALVQSPNGIIFDEYNNRCIFVNWGSNAPIKAISLDSNIVTTIIPTTLSSCDGIARDGQGRYYVSNWGSQTVVRYDSSFLSPPVTVATSLNNPADIFYNVVDDTLAIPNAGNNTVTFVGFGTVSVSETDFENSINIFPNPTSKFLTLQFNQTPIYSEVCIMDLTGRICFKSEFDKNEKNIVLDISDLNSGEYLIYLSDDNQLRYLNKFLKN